MLRMTRDLRGASGKAVAALMIALSVFLIILAFSASIGCGGDLNRQQRKESGIASNIAGRVLFQDAMDGRSQGGWKVAPDVFVQKPQNVTAFQLKAKSEAPWVGDHTWTNYRVEVEILRTGGQFVGLSFHVQDDGVSGCNVHFSATDEDLQERLQAAGMWGHSNVSWKLWPFSQRQGKFIKGQWIKLRLDIGETVANVYVNDDPNAVSTVFDLPFSSGGIRFWEYRGSACFRNLRVTSLAAGDVKPQLEDVWGQASSQTIVRHWKITPPRSPQFVNAANGLEAINSTEVEWLDVKADRRGVVNLTPLFPGDNSKGVVFAKTKIQSDEDTVQACWVTYTDRLILWCNGKKVFEGPPKGWFDPGRDESGGRLIPDQFEVRLPLTQGENDILLRSEVTEPFGWAFWMRLHGTAP